MPNILIVYEAKLQTKYFVDILSYNYCKGPESQVSDHHHTDEEPKVELNICPKSYNQTEDIQTWTLPSPQSTTAQGQLFTWINAYI